MRNTSNRHGFTLIELMIAVAIVGLLAAIAIPNFLTYQTKAKQTEAKIQLKAVHTSEMVYFGENGYFTSDITGLEWRPQTICAYSYSVGSGTLGSASPGGSPMNNAAPGAGASDFTAVAWANIDDDAAVDTWQVTKHYSITNVYNDVTQKEAP